MNGAHSRIRPRRGSWGFGADNEERLLIVFNT